MEPPHTQELEFCGYLEGHGDWVTSIATPQDPASNTIVSASRDKKLIVWKLNPGGTDALGYPVKSLTGHSQPVEDVVISNDGCYAISGSWDRTLRLWDISQGKSLRRFVGHKSDVYSVAFSADNRQIVSGGRDRQIKLWNTLAECKYTIEEDQHTDWISCVRFSPSSKLVVSSGWDKMVKVWNLETCKLRHQHQEHQSTVHSVAISPDGSLCASGGKDGVAYLWDMNEGKQLYTLEASHSINALCFSPCNYWLTAATDKSIVIWDLENKSVLVELKPEKPTRTALGWCISLAWTVDGRTLLAGSTDSNIYMYEVAKSF